MAVVTQDAYKYKLDEIAKVPRPTYAIVECEIYLGNGESLKPMRITDLDIERDFANAISDDGVITVKMRLDQYQRLVLPARETLTMSITYFYAAEMSPNIQHNVKPVVTTYRIYPRDTRNYNLQGNPSIDELRALVDVEFDIAGLLTEHIRMTDVGGIYESIRAIDLLRVLYHEISKDVTDTTMMISKGVDHVEPDVDKVVDYLIIPDGLRMINLPTYLNKYCGGIYNFDIGTYYYKDRWYIYPTFNAGRYTESKRTIDMYVAPPNHMPGSTRTWMLSPDLRKLSIITTGDFKQIDNRDEDSLVNGNGVKFAKASELFDSWATTKGNLSVASAADTTAEFVIKNRDSDMQQIVRIEETDNVAGVLTSLQLRKGYYLLVTWEASRPDLIVPGTPVRLYYMEGGKVVELEATVLKLESHTRQVNPGPQVEAMVTNTAMTLFVTDGNVPIV